jgi:hypothetical protein
MSAAVLDGVTNMTGFTASALLTLDDGDVLAGPAERPPRELRLQPAAHVRSARMQWPVGWMSLSVLSVAALLVFH